VKWFIMNLMVEVVTIFHGNCCFVKSMATKRSKKEFAVILSC